MGASTDSVVEGGHSANIRVVGNVEYKHPVLCTIRTSLAKLFLPTSEPKNGE